MMTRVQGLTTPNTKQGTPTSFANEQDNYVFLEDCWDSIVLSTLDVMSVQRSYSRVYCSRNDEWLRRDDDERKLS